MSSAASKSPFDGEPGTASAAGGSWGNSGGTPSAATKSEVDFDVDYASFREGFLACWVWEYGDSRYEPDDRIIRRQYQQWTRTNPVKS